MNVETRITIILMCAVFTLFSCTKKAITPAEDPQPSVVDFRASSQAVWVKSASTTFSDYHSDFGVWGIAREPLNTPYILWDDNDLTQVTKPQGSDVYVPASPAYWFNRYTYNFIAIAPFTNSGIQETSVNSATNTLTFDYNIKNKYDLKGVEGKSAKDHYEFDLMGAVDQVGPVSSSTASTQTLIFWHLFAKISLKVQFEDAAGNALTSGSVSQVRIANLDAERIFVVKYSTETEGNNTEHLSVECNAIASAQETTVSFTSTDAKDSEGRWNVHILPQTISDLVLYIDYTITENGNTTYYSDSISLRNSNPSAYIANGRYNWTLKIVPKGTISFSVVEVEKWGSEQIGSDIEIK